MTDRQTDRQPDRHPDRQTDRHAGRQTQVPSKGMKTDWYPKICRAAWYTGMVSPEIRRQPALRLST